MIAGVDVRHADASELTEQELVQAGELCRNVGSMPQSEWQRQMEPAGFAQAPDQKAAYLGAWTALYITLNNVRQRGDRYFTRKESKEEAIQRVDKWEREEMANDGAFVFQNHLGWTFVVSSKRKPWETKPRGKCVLIAPEIASPEIVDRAIARLLVPHAKCYPVSRFLPEFYHVGCGFLPEALGKATFRDQSEREDVGYMSLAASNDRETGEPLPPYSHIVFNLRARPLY